MIFFTYGAFKVMAFLKCRFCLAHLTLLLSHLCATQACNMYTQLHIMSLKKITENKFRPVEFLVLEGQHTYSFELNSLGLCNTMRILNKQCSHILSHFFLILRFLWFFLQEENYKKSQDLMGQQIKLIHAVSNSDYIKSFFISVPSDYCRTYKISIFKYTH